MTELSHHINRFAHYQWLVDHSALANETKEKPVRNSSQIFFFLKKKKKAQGEITFQWGCDGAAATILLQWRVIFEDNSEHMEDVKAESWKACGLSATSFCEWIHKPQNYLPPDICYEK